MFSAPVMALSTSISVTVISSHVSPEQVFNMLRLSKMSTSYFADNICKYIFGATIDPYRLNFKWNFFLVA